jgi:HEAT repeat protein
MPRNDPSRAPALGGKSQHDQTQSPRLGGDAALTHVIVALQDADVAVRERALEALEEIGSEQALDLLIQSSQDQHISVRRRAFGALARLQGAAVAATLRAGLSDSDDTIRQIAVVGIGMQRDPQDFDALLRILRYDESALVRVKAAMALAEVGDVRATEDLIRASHHGNPDWRPYSHALRRLYEQQRQVVSDALVEYLLDSGHYYYSPLFPALNLIRPVEALPALIEAAEASNRAIPVRCRAIRSIAEIQQPDKAPVLIRLMNATTEPEQVRIHAARMVGKLKSRAVAPALVEVLLRGGIMARAAAKGLQYNRDSQVVPTLLNLLEHEDWKTRRRVIEILRPRKLAVTIPAIMQRLSDSRGEVREMAIRALGFIRPLEALPALIRSLREDRVAKVRESAVLAISRLNDPAGLPGLADALGDDANKVRVTAAVELYRLLNTHRDWADSMREALLPYQNDPDHTVRFYVNQCLRIST